MAEAKLASYVLGHSEKEVQRLALQGQFWGEVALELLQHVTVEAGMMCWASVVGQEIFVCIRQVSSALRVQCLLLV